jgi:hypothetical protein
MSIKEIKLLEILSKFYIQMSKAKNEGMKLVIMVQAANDIEELFKEDVS